MHAARTCLRAMRAVLHVPALAATGALGLTYEFARSENVCESVCESAHTQCKSLESAADARDISQHRGILIKCDRETFRHCADIETSVLAAAKRADVPVRCMDAHTPTNLAEYMTMRFAAWEPATVVVLEEYLTTGRKWIFDEFKDEAADAGRARSFVDSALTHTRAPTRISAQRPVGDVSTQSPYITEVVASSFDELVLRAGRPVLLEAYTPVCDACKAFAPRLRMIGGIAARRLPSLRVAAMDILNNDRPMEHIPETATPVIRLFVPAAPASNAASVPWADAAEGQAFPSIPDAIEFVLKHAGIALSEADRRELLEEAEGAEREARILEQLYLQALAYMGLWNAYANSDGAKPAVARRLHRQIMDLYTYILTEAAQGGSERALQLAEKVHQTAKAAGIDSAQLAAAAAGGA